MSIEAVASDPQQLELFRNQSDIVVRRRVTLWEPEPPKHKILMELYRHWEALRPTGFLPSRSQFEMDKLRPIMGMASIVDVGPNDPLGFLIRLQGTMLPFPDHSKHALADIM